MLQTGQRTAAGAGAAAVGGGGSGASCQGGRSAGSTASACLTSALGSSVKELESPDSSPQLLSKSVVLRRGGLLGRAVGLLLGLLCAPHRLSGCSTACGGRRPPAARPRRRAAPATRAAEPATRPLATPTRPAARPTCGAFQGNAKEML